MPVLKSITGHSPSVKKCIQYLCRDGTAPADFINCYVMNSPLDVAEQMDITRRFGGNDRPIGNKKAVTFKHYVISPDPEDNVSLEQLQELTRKWANKFFSDFEVAIYYHNDNKNSIPHAHVVVNNTNLETGKRLAPYLTNKLVRQLNHDLQDMAKELGLSSFNNDFYKNEVRGQIQTLQRTKYHRAANELKARGEASWVEDIRTRIWCAMQLATNEPEFLEECKRFGLGVQESTQKRREKDFVYTHPSKDTWKITGGKLGSDWTRFMIGSQLSRSKLSDIPKLKGEELEWMHAAIDALQSWEGAKIGLLGISQNGYVSLEDFAALLEVCKVEDVQSIEDLDDLIRSTSDSERVEYLGHILEVALETNALPQKRSERLGPRTPLADIESDSFFDPNDETNSGSHAHTLSLPSDSNWVVTRNDDLQI